MAEHGAGRKETLQDKLARLAEQGRGKSRTETVTFSIEKFQLDLFNKEMDGRFSAYPLRPGSEFPTFLTRIPIFLPIKRGRKNPPLDQDNAMPFVTSWGRGRKHGPPLTVYDEDTLMAIARLRKNRLQGRPHHLRKNRLQGRPHHMPIPLSAIQPRGQQHKDGEIAVHVLACTMSDIQGECEDSDGGTNMQHRLASIKRLGATVMEFDRVTRDKLGYRGTQVKLIDVAWDVYEVDAVLLIQFSPLMADWLESEYTYINWEVRKQLSDTGKALHRFFSAQPKHYAIKTEKLMQTIGYQRSYGYFMSDLRSTMQKLQALGWLDDWDITGTGRKVPHKLTFSR
jgi:hypothetical protein